jgi:hypothetical protein
MRKKREEKRGLGIKQNDKKERNKGTLSLPCDPFPLNP